MNLSLSSLYGQIILLKNIYELITTQPLVEQAANNIENFLLYKHKNHIMLYVKDTKNNLTKQMRQS